MSSFVAKKLVVAIFVFVVPVLVNTDGTRPCDDDDDDDDDDGIMKADPISHEKVEKRRIRMEEKNEKENRTAVLLR